jgi:FMN reductase
MTPSHSRLPLILGISGNAQRPSKTRVLVHTVVECIEAHYGFAGEAYDLADAPELGQAIDHKGIAGKLAELIRKIESADALVVGTPVYKGSYTGLFKHLFDLIGPDKLMGKPVVLTASGGGDRHALVVEHQLRPLFGFFAAHSMATAIYVNDADFADGKIKSEPALKRIDCAVAELRPWLAPFVKAPAA